MLSIDFLLDLAIILLSTKALGILTKKIQMPQVVGALISGLILGPAFFNVINETDFIAKMAELGVIVLMFGAGIETDLDELKKCGRASFFIAALGVIVPLLSGFLIASLFHNKGTIFSLSHEQFFQNLFIGIILTATSVSITVETLQEMGKLKSSVGTVIMGAAVIDDILAIILLTLSISVVDSSVNIWMVLFRIMAFFAFSVLVGIIFHRIFGFYSRQCGEKRRIPIMGFVLCLLMAYIAERYFGVADIIGAYLAGIFISKTCKRDYVERKIQIIGYMILSPIFFASIGIRTSLENFSSDIVIFALCLLIVAILSKIVGASIGAKLFKYSNQDSLRIGIGMVARSEVALIMANKGVSIGIMDGGLFAPIILVVIATTLITPVLLKMAYRRA